MSDPHPALISAQRHAIKAAPQESCGLLIQHSGTVVYLGCRNEHAEPTRAFRISPTIIASWMRKGKLAAIIHSHPHPAPAGPSDADRRGQAAMAVPWAIIPVDEHGEAGAPVWLGRGDHS